MPYLVNLQLTRIFTENQEGLAVRTPPYSRSVIELNICSQRFVLLLSEVFGKPSLKRTLVKRLVTIHRTSKKLSCYQIIMDLSSAQEAKYFPFSERLKS